MRSREIAFPLGCYQGCLISDAPSDYLKWVFEEDNIHFGDEIKEAAQEEYQFRTQVKGHWNGHLSTYSNFTICK